MADGIACYTERLKGYYLCCYLSMSHIWKLYYCEVGPIFVVIGYFKQIFLEYSWIF